MNGCLAAAQAIPAVSRTSAIVLLWVLIGVAAITLVLPRGRRIARQIYAVAVLGFREGIRLKLLWTVLVLSVIPGALAYFSEADGTHAGRARLILDTCLSSGEVLGAALIVLLSALSVAREIESRIMHTFGTKPIPRWAILAGKTLGFWAVDILFLAGLALFTGALVRMVPLRNEARTGGSQVVSGDWEDLRRNTLTTRYYRNGDNEPEKAMYKFIAPGNTFQWNFTTDPAESKGDPLALRILISSTHTFASRIDDVKVVAGYAGKAPLIDRNMTILTERPLDLFLEHKDIVPGTLNVTITASTAGRYPPSIVAQRPRAVQVGITGDSFEMNMLKSFLLMAIQGWILAVITTSWSGVLSFPVTVALGAILVLGGEMSREALQLLQASAQRSHSVTVGLEAADSADKSVLVQFVLKLLPDFRAAGSPAAFSEGTLLSGWGLAEAALWMGVVRGVGWALPGFVFFNAREVGR